MTPTSEQELVDAIASTADPFKISGGGTRPVGKPIEGTPLSVSNLSGIKRYEPHALTLVAAAGTPLSDIEAELAANGQRLAFEPIDHRGLLGTVGEPTVGGMTAANASGPRRVQAGACRDFLLGVRFVDGEGNIIQNGGRVMKNVTGYDLARLMAGSYGTLGVLTEVAFKVLPQPESSAVLLLNGLSDEAAIAALAKALSSPFEVTGAAHTQRGLDGEPVTMIRVEGFEDSVRYRINRLKEMFVGVRDYLVESDPEKTKAGWKWVRDVEAFHAKGGDVWRISVKPSEAHGLVKAIQRQQKIECLYDWGGGLIWALVREGTDLREFSGVFAGHATLIRASAETRSRLAVFHPQPAVVQRISKRLQHKFDPRRILNPGLMG